ncbi:MAG: matrixin family metalloprotease [Fimbriimonadaceae bacterium]
MKFNTTFWIALSATLIIGAIGCGGGGSSSSGNTPLSCGPNYLTPNYVEATDPGNSQANLILTWPGFPLNVYFASNQTATFSGNTYDTTDTFTEALTRWKTASSGSMTFTEINTATGADITVNVNQLSAAPGGGGTLGYTQVTYYPSTKQIVSANVTMNTWPGMTQAQFVDGLKSTAAHEFGHALFLQGHSDQNADNMYYQGSSALDKPLTQRDTNSFLTAYCGNFATRGIGKPAAQGFPGEQPVTKTIYCKGN